MKDNILIEKSINFGARIVKLHSYLLKTKHESVLSKQILRSGTSIGANINEAQYGNSKADFILLLNFILLSKKLPKQNTGFIFWKNQII